MEGKACDLVSKVDGNGLAVLDILAVHVELDAALAQVIDSAVNVVGQDSNVAIGAAARLLHDLEFLLAHEDAGVAGLDSHAQQAGDGLSGLGGLGLVLAVDADVAQLKAQHDINGLTAHCGDLVPGTGEAVHLVIRDGRDIVYIYKTESGPMRMSSRVGLRSPLYCTGVGKAILATLPGDELEDIWTHSNVQKLTDKTITDLEELRSQLVEVRANGYAIDDEENELGVRCVAVAIPGPDGRAESAFSISGLAPYMTPERIRRIATLALDARTDILADLGLR